MLIAADETLTAWTASAQVENGLAVKRCVALVPVTGVPPNPESGAVPAAGYWES